MYTALVLKTLHVNTSSYCCIWKKWKSPVGSQRLTHLFLHKLLWATLLHLTTLAHDPMAYMPQSSGRKDVCHILSCDVGFFASRCHYYGCWFPLCLVFIRRRAIGWDSKSMMSKLPLAICHTFTPHRPILSFSSDTEVPPTPRNGFSGDCWKRQGGIDKGCEANGSLLSELIRCNLFVADSNTGSHRPSLVIKGEGELPRQKWGHNLKSSHFFQQQAFYACCIQI